MTTRRWTPAEIASPIGKYSHLASPRPGHAVCISGQAGLDRDGNLLIEMEGAFVAEAIT